MVRKQAFLIIAGIAVFALLLWRPLKRESQHPTADAVATSETDAIQQLSRLLLQKPDQAEFAIGWQSESNEGTGWSDLKYRRAKHTLIYTPDKDFGKGCPKQYICESVFDTLFTKGTHLKSIGAIMYASGCNAPCLTGCDGGCLTSE